MLECWHIIPGSLVEAALGEAGGHLEATGDHPVAAVGADERIRLVGIRGHRGKIVPDKGHALA